MPKRTGNNWKITALCILLAVLVSTQQGFGASAPADDGDGESTTVGSDFDDYPDEDTDSEDYQDLQLDGEMQDQTLRSGERLQFRCRVSVTPKKDLRFTWYHDNMVIDSNSDERITIKDRDWGSRLQILNLYTADSGNYRCEASDGEKSVITTAKLTVAFNLPPSGGATDIDKKLFEGKCELYGGFACAEYLKGKYIYVEVFEQQEQRERQITAALSLLGDTEKVSEKCARFARPAFCHYVFPLCEKTSEDSDDVFVYDFAYDISDSSSTIDLAAAEGTASAIRLCREDCELLQHDVCAEEFATDDPVIKPLVQSSDCSKLPRTTATGTKCSRLGLKSVIDRKHVCYNDTGTRYKGVVATTLSSAQCRTWPAKMLVEYPELVGGHNFCRNPGNEMDQPWCYTDRERIQREGCNVPKCKSATDGGSSDLLVILIPCLSIPLLIGCILVVMCFACRKGRKDKDAKHSPGKKVEMKAMAATKTVIPELPAGLVHFSIELGEGKYGKVYKAQIMTNMIFAPAEPVAVKTVAAGAMQAQITEFRREMEMYANLQHINVACLKACVMQPSLRCMIFEYTSRMDLHEMLTLHSPHSDVGGGKISGGSASSHTSSSLESGDFLHMAVQVACGLEYLAERNFVHRDLAARNILVCSNDVMKISNLGVVRDCYLSSYYRSPQGGHMLPVRWMAPESLNSNFFSEKTAVWSFGVLIWEMFSYGMQPYCGYSNHEVIDMISKGQALTCPDQCSSRVYALVRECWASDPNIRPTSKDIHAKLCGWEGATTTRMTSQLAQGIHRQLNNSIREGAQFQYSPPVQGNVAGGYGQQYMASPAQPGAPHVSPVSQAYYTSPSASSSVTQQPPSYPVYMQQPQAYGPVQMYPQPQTQYTRPHPVPNPYIPGHTHSSSRSTDSGGSSVRNQLHAYRPQSGGLQVQHHGHQQQHYQPQAPLPPQPEYENFNNNRDGGVQMAKGVETRSPPLQDEQYHSASTMSASPPPVVSHCRPGSELIQDDARLPSALYSNGQQANTSAKGSVPAGGKPPIAAKPPVPLPDSNRPRANIVMGLNGQRNRNHSNHLDNASASDARNQLNSGEVAQSNLTEGQQNQRNGNASDGKAPSCDSGLPNDDPEPDSTSENQPFLPSQANARVILKGNKPVIQIPPGSSSSSSTSGSTAATAESRLTA